MAEAPAVPKKNYFSLEALFYIAGTGAAIWLVWAIYTDLFGTNGLASRVTTWFGGVLDKDSVILDQWATDFGYNYLSAQSDPFLKYSLEMSVAARAANMTRAKYATRADVPTLEDWQDGEPFPIP